MIEGFFARNMAKFGKIGALFELGRPWNGLLMGLVGMLGYNLMATEPSLFYGFVIFLTFVLVYAAGTSINDIYDYEADKINMPYRPLQSGRATIKDAYLFSLFFYVCSSLLATFVGFEFFVLVVCFIILSLTYSLPPVRLVSRGLAGNVNLALVTVFIPAYAGATAALNSFDVSAAFTYAFLAFTALFIFASFVKDLKDMTGDRERGKRTVAVVLGKQNTIVASVIGTGVFFPLTTHLISGFFDYQVWPYLLSLPIFLLLIFTEANKTGGYDQNIEDERFGKVRLVLLPYVLLFLLFSFM